MPNEKTDTIKAIGWAPVPVKPAQAGACIIALREDAPDVAMALENLCTVLDITAKRALPMSRELIDAAISALMFEVGITDTDWLMM